MSKGNYTHVQELLSEIKAMLAAGKTQREVAEHFVFFIAEQVYEIRRLRIENELLRDFLRSIERK